MPDPRPRPEDPPPGPRDDAAADAAPGCAQRRTDGAQPADPAALERLVHEHQAAIWRYLRFLGCDPAEADDLTQDTFVAVATGPLHRFARSATRSYLRRVARNAFLKLRERQRRVGMAPLDDLDLADAETAFDWFDRGDDGAAALAALRECLGRLDATARRALALRYAGAQHRAAIAAALQMSSDGVKSLLQRSYARLRACIRRRLGDA